MTPSPLFGLLDSEEARIIGLSLVHFVWQGVLLGLASSLALRLIDEHAARLRYLVACLGLLVMVGTPFATAAWVAGTADPPPSASRGSAPSVLIDEPAVSPGRTVEGTAASETGGDRQAGAWNADREERSRLILSWVVGAWLLGVLVLLLRHVGGWFYLRRRVLGRAHSAGKAVRRQVRKLSPRMGLSRPVRTLVVDGLASPMVVGWIRPAVVVPLSLVASLPATEVEALLAHELAHVKRLDYLVNLLQTSAETILFYHPAVWWLSDRIRHERERCCDEIAARVCGDRRACARALARLAGAAGSGRWSLAADGGSITERIRQLVRPTPNHPGARGGLAVAAMSGFSVVILAGVLSQAPLMTTTGASSEAATAAGDRVETSLQDSPLSDRWDRAVRSASTGADFWLAWGIRRDAGGPTVVSNSPGGPPHEGGRETRSYLDGISDGPSPAAVLFFGFRDDTTDVAWVRLRGPSVAVDLGGRPLHWLGTVTTGESIGQLERLLGRSTSPEVRKELAAALALHAETDRVVDAVGRLQRRERTPSVRAEALAWLDRHRGDSVAELYHRVVESDPSALVRKQAVGSLEDYPPSISESWLVETALGDPDPGVRERAAQALGDQEGANAAAALEQVIFGDEDAAVRLSALEALVELDDGAIPGIIDRVVERHPDGALQRRARDEAGW